MHAVRTALIATTLPMLLIAGGCTPTRDVTRVPADAVIDIDPRFNDVDARQVYQGMVNDALFRSWIDNWMREHNGQRPIIIVGTVRNETQDYIDTKNFTKQFEREMLNSGRVRVVAMRDERGELRDERLEGQEWNRPETRKLLRNELGADLMLLGRVADQKQRSLDGRTVVSYYQVNLELIDIESNEKVWIGTEEVKKVARTR